MLAHIVKISPKKMFWHTVVVSALLHIALFVLLVTQTDILHQERHYVMDNRKTIQAHLIQMPLTKKAPIKRPAQKASPNAGTESLAPKATEGIDTDDTVEQEESSAPLSPPDWISSITQPRQYIPFPDESVWVSADKDEEEDIINRYIALIARSVQRHWRRPNSARRGMEVTLLVNIRPSGTITGITIEKGSGNTAFDQSAYQAVKKTGTIVGLASMDAVLFDKHFRQLRFKFKPSDIFW